MWVRNINDGIASSVCVGVVFGGDARRFFCTRVGHQACGVIRNTNTRHAGGARSGAKRPPPVSSLAWSPQIRDVGTNGAHCSTNSPFAERTWVCEWRVVGGGVASHVARLMLAGRPHLLLLPVLARWDLRSCRLASRLHIHSGACWIARIGIAADAADAGGG